MQPRKIFLFSDVNKFTVEYLIRQLLEFDRQSSEEITMFINSPGGSVVDLFALIDTMDMIKSPIRTVVMGMAASAAAVIASAGTTRLITENSQFMLHEVFAGAMGTSSQISEEIKRVEEMEVRLLNILAKHTGKSAEKLKALIKDRDKYFTAEEAVRFGLADQVIKTDEAQILKLSEGINVEGYEINLKKEGLSEVQLLVEGKFAHPEYGEILLTSKTLEKICENFKNRVRGIDIALDYTHDNEGGEKRAAGWIKSLEIRSTDKGQGLFASVEFTPKGRELVQQKEFKYASADFVIDYMDQTGKHFPYVLRGGTLTNRPFIKEMHPIQLSEYNQAKEEIKNMNKEALIAALKDAGVDVVALQSSATEAVALKAENQELQNRIKELAALPATKDTEIKALKDQLEETNQKLITKDLERVFNSLVAAGKVVPAQKETLLKMFKKPEELEAFYKDALPVVSTEAKGKGGEGSDETLTKAEEEILAQGEFTKEQIIAGRTRASYRAAKKAQTAAK